MKKLLVKIFIKDYKNTKSEIVRSKYGALAGAVGIVTNMFLAIFKVVIGIIAVSPAIIADGINNLSDGLSSIITLVGFKLSTKAADKDHPFGHQRIEYISGLIISFIILAIGFSLGKESISGIIDLIKGKAKPLNISNPFLIIGCLVLSILVKCWQAVFYKKMGKDIDSSSLKASSSDSLNDCITTFAVLISTIIFIVSKEKVNIDSIAGLIVAIFIIFSSIDLIKDTVNPLLGNIPSDEEVKEISEKIKSYQGILGIHDLVVHSYGPNINYVTVHAEVSREVDVMESHELIDTIERDFRNNLGIDLTIHMDPIEVHDEYTLEIKEKVREILKDIDPKLEFHDFRVVKGPNKSNILFDVVMPIDYPITAKELKEGITKVIHDYNNNWYAVIQVDQFYNRIN